MKDQCNPLSHLAKPALTKERLSAERPSVSNLISSVASTEGNPSRNLGSPKIFLTFPNNNKGMFSAQYKKTSSHRGCILKGEKSLVFDTMFYFAMDKKAKTYTVSNSD